MENTLAMIFRLLAGAVSLYATICFVRIMITWVPRINYSSFGTFLSQLCDPYLYIFSRLPLRVGMLDFTPVLSLGLLTLLSSVLNGIARSGKIYIGGILAEILSLIWSIGSTFLGIMLLLFFIRYCVAIFVKSSNNYDSPWQMLDNSISKLVYRIAKPLAMGKPTDYKKALLLACALLLTMLIAGNFLIRILIGLCVLIPF